MNQFALQCISTGKINQTYINSQDETIHEVIVNAVHNRCFVAGSCSNPQQKCNCDRNDNTERSDEGFLTYKDHLPVTELQFGDAGASRERGWHTLGPLICSN